MIRCQCGKVIFDGIVLKIRVGQFADGHMNLKCPSCKFWLSGLPIKILTSELKEDIDFQKNSREVQYGSQGTHR